ncbi:MAG TPA: sigma-54-dependent Fis family transcriptional regulator, partial [Kofleriaceae bacterium]|nr:sigma-54-dependent Fis family transcriptional regulator [Kofleriaceae bacterium]
MSERQDPTLSIAQPDLPATPPPEAWLVIAQGTSLERRVAIGERALCIGKDATADISIAGDPHISRHHAELFRGPNGVVLVDGGSRNGTFVNGVLVKEAVLTHGAVITLGTTSIHFETLPGAARGSAPEASFLASDQTPPASPKMREVYTLLARLAPTDINITILGETGAGKDVLARAIHAASPRKDGPFVVFDSGAVAPNLVESELFGHERGAFTGAVADREGAFERAHGGTLFLDEIGELPLTLQPRLLRALEQRTVKRLGGSTVRHVDVRVLAATNRDLESEVMAGT